MLQGDVPFETESDIVGGYLPFETEITPGVCVCVFVCVFVCVVLALLLILS